MTFYMETQLKLSPRQTVNASWKSYFEYMLCFIDFFCKSRVVFNHNGKYVWVLISSDDKTTLYLSCISF